MQIGPAVLALARDLALCAHESAIVVHDRAQWCSSCGAIRAVGVEAWLEPRSWIRAKEIVVLLDRLVEPLSSAGGAGDPKNVISIKPRT